MAEVAISTGGEIDLLHDLGVGAGVEMTAQTAGNRNYDCVVDTAYATTELRTQRALGGLYRATATGIDIEIEMVRLADAVRSLIYVKSGVALYVSLPAGVYGFRYRILSPPGKYRASLTFKPLSPVDRIRLYGAKAWRVLRQRPSALLPAALSFLKASRQAVTAVRLADACPQSAPPLTLRPSLIPPPVLGEPAGVSIIIPSRDRMDLLAPCIASLEQLVGVRAEVIVVDNGSVQAHTLTWLQAFAARPDVRVIRHDIPFNFSRLCNAGAQLARHDNLLFLNDDVEALDGLWLGHMLAWLARNDVGAVGARLLYPSGDLQHAGIASNLVPGPGHPWRGASRAEWEAHPLLAEAGEVDAVTGACLLVRRRDFEAAGGFDETDFAITLNDVDLCLKLRRQGQKIIYAPQATLLHKEGQSRRGDDDPAEVARRRRELKTFFDRYPDFARNSCFYPPWLRRDGDQALSI